MKRFIFTALALAGFAPLANAQIDAENIQRSQWDTTYEALGGGRVRARLTFDGDGGFYNAGQSRGRLSDVDYEVRLGGGATVKGKWAMGGSSGRFTFFVAGNSRPPVFSGSWQSGGKSGTWNGKFVQVVQASGGGGGSVTYDKTWSYNDAKRYYYKKCRFPAGGYQYLIYYEAKPNWVYWYNPGAEVFWCACPTVNHPKWGQAIENGEDLFLMASTKAKNIEDAEFPDPGDDGANFKKGKAKDKDGSTVDLSCPPPDLP